MILNGGEIVNNPPNDNIFQNSRVDCNGQWAWPHVDQHCQFTAVWIDHMEQLSSTLNYAYLETSGC